MVQGKTLAKRCYRTAAPSAPFEVFQTAKHSHTPGMSAGHIARNANAMRVNSAVSAPRLPTQQKEALLKLSLLSTVVAWEHLRGLLCHQGLATLACTSMLTQIRILLHLTVTRNKVQEETLCGHVRICFVRHTVTTEATYGT